MVLFCLVFKSSNLGRLLSVGLTNTVLWKPVIPNAGNNNFRAFRDWDGKPYVRAGAGGGLRWAEKESVFFFFKYQPSSAMTKRRGRGWWRDLSASNTEASFHFHLFPPFSPYTPRVGWLGGEAGVKAAGQDQRAKSPGPSQIRSLLGERVRLGVEAGGRTSESKVGYWLGHILEERVSQSCLCRNPLVGVVVQHLLEGEMYADFSDMTVD